MTYLLLCPKQDGRVHLACNTGRERDRYGIHWDHIPTINEILAEITVDRHLPSIPTWKPEPCHFDLIDQPQLDRIAANPQATDWQRTTAHGYTIQWRRIDTNFATRETTYYPEIRAAYVCSLHGVHPKRVYLKQWSFLDKWHPIRDTHWTMTRIDIDDHLDAVPQPMLDYRAERVARNAWAWDYRRRFELWTPNRSFETSHEAW